MADIDIAATSSAAATGAVGIVVALALAATGSSIASITGNLDLNAHRLAAYSTGVATSLSELDVKNSQLAAYSTGVATSLSEIGMLKSLSATTSGSASSSSVLVVAIKLEAATTATAVGTCSLTPRLDTLSLDDVIREVLNLWGIEGTCNAPDFALARAINDVNAAMQTIWNQAADRSYWTGSTLTLTFADGEDAQDLPTNIQNVVGPCRRADNKRPLATIGSIGELETFSDLYLDGETADEPLAYHIDRLNQTGNDPAKTVLRITPPVTGDDVDFLLDVVTEAPRFSKGDVSLGIAIPIPHRYVESLLLPIVRYKASSFWLYNNGESKPTIDRDYQLAMEAIGAADPLPGKSGDNKEASKK